MGEAQKEASITPVFALFIRLELQIDVFLGTTAIFHPEMVAQLR